jgi:chemotaxis signal transduction protein
MLALVMESGGSQYVLPAKDVVEIVPYVTLESEQAAEPPFVGILAYRRQRVPVIDLAQHYAGIRSCHRLSTRIVLVRNTATGGLVGLIVEGATETAEINAVRNQHSASDLVYIDVTDILQKYLSAGSE